MEIHERVNRVLRFLQSKTTVLGAKVPFSITGDVISRLDPDLDADKTTIRYYQMLACSESVSGGDFQFLLNYLAQTGFIERIDADFSTQSCSLTVDGISRLSEISKTNKDSSKAFVAMWFDDSTREAWTEGIEPAVRAAGFDPIRMDEIHHANKICDEIVAWIMRSRFVVADFTQGEDGARGGVYYEAGFAHGLGIQVIFCCHSNSMDKLHFDTRQYNHIEWKEPIDLRKQLTARICAVIGDGPGKTD